MRSLRLTAPLYAPDGMGSLSASLAFEAVHAHDRHDDGLVHNHNWATRSDEEAMTILRTAATPQVFTASSTATLSHWDDRYDDGLVHNHDWAVSGK